MMRLVFLLFLAVPAFAQETPVPTPGQIASAAAVCGPLAVSVTCWTWTRFPTANTGPTQVSRCQPQGAAWWQPEGRWDRVCSASAGPGEACMANAMVIGPRRVVCDGGTWAP